MGKLDDVKLTIDANIRENGNEDITGGVLNLVLTDVIEAAEVELVQLDNRVSVLEQNGGGSGGGGGGGECVDDSLIRTLYTVDESVGETLTEEQREYNAETYRMLADGLTPMVVYEGCVGAVVGINMGADDGFAHIFVKIDTGPYLAGGTVLLRKDGSVELREEHFAYKLAVLTEPEAAQLFFENYEVFTELKGVIKGMDDSGVIYSEVDLVGYKGELPYVEYNLHDKRFRVEFNADYTIKEAVEISSVAASIVQEIVDNECVTAAALNDLNDRIKELEERLKNAGL